MTNSGRQKSRIKENGSPFNKLRRGKRNVEMKGEMC